jgi:hypothetical protein
MTRRPPIHALAAPVALILALGMPPGAGAEETEAPPAPCTTSEARQFDFWIGTWDLTWEGGTGTNVITSELGGCVVEENFDGRDAEGKGLVGRSVSVYSPAKGKWLQTWVDNSGGYLDFEGGWNDADATMELRRQAERDGKTFLQRMVFFNISDRSLDWNWERSDDGGATWKTLWAIHYARRK